MSPASSSRFKSKGANRRKDRVESELGEIRDEDEWLDRELSRASLDEDGIDIVDGLAESTDSDDDLSADDFAEGDSLEDDEGDDGDELVIEDLLEGAEDEPGSVTFPFTTVDAYANRAVRYVLNRNELVHSDDFPQVIAVVSSIAGEGVSTMARALASVLGSDFSASVCLIDLASFTDGNQPLTGTAPGVAELVEGTAVFDDVVQPSNLPTVDVLSAGDSGMIESGLNQHRSELADVVESARRRYDHVIIDAPPVLANPDALSVMNVVDSYLLVARSGVTTAQQVSSVTDLLSSVPPFGAVLNRHRTRTPKFIQRFMSD